jgi:antitoxin (DNA-binding transcriptional repressor) of toxin-antitoxin stability system
MKVITATEASRSFSELLNQVYYRGESFEIQKGKEVFAKLVPSGPQKGARMSDLNELFASLPHLDKKDAARFAKDLKIIRKEMAPHKDPWA